MDDQPEQAKHGKQGNQQDIIIPQPEYPKQVQATIKKPTYVTDFPYCPVRVGRVSENVAEDGGRSVSAVPTCGFRDVTLNDCLECIPQHMLNENKILNGKKLVKNSGDIRELKQRLDATENNIEELKKIIGFLVATIKR